MPDSPPQTPDHSADRPREKGAARPTRDRPILALDTASPTVSLALGRDRQRAVVRTIDLRQSSERLLASIDEVLREADCHLGDLAGVVALRGPGSFTGLRVGLGTVIGLHQALGLPVTALPTLPILARTAGEHLADGQTVIAVVDALRGQWMAQSFTLEGGEPQPLDSPSLRTLEELTGTGRSLVGFGLVELTAQLEPAAEPGAEPGADGQRFLDAPPLAPYALGPAFDSDWDPGALVSPIYFRPPAVTPPKRSARPETADEAAPEPEAG